MNRVRVISFIDGFNLYHAIARLKKPYLKWVDLRALSKVFIKSKSEKLMDVFYFSALVDHLNKSIQERQNRYIRALKIKGTKPILGHFKKKNRKCPKCSHKWIGYEEKETDVNIALFLLNLAYQNSFDRALVISNDSDLAPAIQMVRQRFPKKQITTIAPPHSFHINELIKVSSDKSKIQLKHLQRCLLPETVTDASGIVFVKAPKEYKRIPIEINT